MKDTLAFGVENICLYYKNRRKRKNRLADLGHDLRVRLSNRVSPLYSDRVPPNLDLATH